MSSRVHGPDPLFGMLGPPCGPGKKPVTEPLRPGDRRSPAPDDLAAPDGPHDPGSDRPVTPDVCWATEELETFQEQSHKHLSQSVWSSRARI